MSTVSRNALSIKVFQLASALSSRRTQNSRRE